MALTPLTALSPLDGRYAGKLEPLRRHFSELGLIGYRVRIEIEWLKALAAERVIKEVPAFSAATIRQLDAIAGQFSEADGAAVKAIEARTNHDVKAIEYFRRDRLEANAEIAKVAEFIHFACTSEDINNLCHALMLKAARDEVMLPALGQIIECLAALAHKLAGAAMLAHTHGQPA
ncbi:MAG: adenylosuccinate lyase, partial [Betaproteobacteria bacterium]|nr:adenylosuccinate lyase [Betaproteobacteria bacterium]